MNSIIGSFFSQHGPAGSILTLVVACIVGLLIGKISFRGIKLGIAGVLFSALFFGHLQLPIDHNILDFCREFGLMLFVYMVGLQVGQGIDSALKSSGLILNLLAVGVVLLGALITVGFCLAGWLDVPEAVGILSGATTNTPSLGTAQQAIRDVNAAPGELLDRVSIGYAVAYPFGIIGTILSILLLQRVLRISAHAEAEDFEAKRRLDHPQVTSKSFVISNENLSGKSIDQIPMLSELKVTISRIRQGSEVKLATREALVKLGDTLQAVGTAAALEKFGMIVGRPSEINVAEVPSSFASNDIIVTNRKIVGKTLPELGVHSLYAFNVTRLRRGELEFVATMDLELQLGDSLRVVGSDASLQQAHQLFGNAVKKLAEPELLTVFVGLVIGILLGSIPISLPGVPVPVKLGLAGGPLLVAIAMGRWGRVGSISTYFPLSANLAIREFGILLFLSAVGLKAGEHFAEILLHGAGLYWIGFGALITLIPLVTMSFIGRLRYQVNYLTMSGVIAGSMTDPPALAFANSLASSHAASLGYATVYPLTMLLRMFTAQLLVIYGMS